MSISIADKLLKHAEEKNIQGQIHYFLNNGSKIQGNLQKIDPFFLHINYTESKAGQEISAPLLMIRSTLATITIENPSVMDSIFEELEKMDKSERFKQDDILFTEVLSEIASIENFSEEDPYKQLVAHVYLLKATRLIGLPIAYDGNCLVLYSDYYNRNRGQVKEIQFIMLDASTSVMSKPKKEHYTPRR